MIRFRFVEGSGLSSALIEYREGTCMPIIPSHVECVDPENGEYIGQHMDGGMRSRSPGYDKPFVGECFVDLPATPQQVERFYDAARKAIGDPYDWKAILGFALPGHFHSKYHAICSAKMFLLLREIDWFPSHAPLTVPAHCIDPRDLFLILSSHVQIDH